MRYTTAPLLRPALARLSGAWPLLQLSYFVTRLRVYSGKPCYNQETIQSQVRASTHAKIKCQKQDPQQFKCTELLPGSTSLDKSHLKTSHVHTGSKGYHLQPSGQLHQMMYDASLYPLLKKILYFRKMSHLRYEPLKNIIFQINAPLAPPTYQLELSY